MRFCWQSSGDPFTFAYLAYLPTTCSNPDDVARSLVGPYHAWCQNDALQLDLAIAASCEVKEGGILYEARRVESASIDDTKGSQTERAHQNVGDEEAEAVATSGSKTDRRAER